MERKDKPCRKSTKLMRKTTLKNNFSSTDLQTKKEHLYMPEKEFKKT